VRAANVNEPVQCQSRSRSSVRSIGHEKAAEGEKQSRRKRGSNPARSLLSGGFLVAFCKERMETQENCSSQKTVEYFPLSVPKDKDNKKPYITFPPPPSLFFLFLDPNLHQL